MTRKSIVSALIAMTALLPVPALAQDDTEPLSWSGYELTPLGPPDGLSVAQVNGREVLTVRRTGALLDGAEFSQGVIEFDVAFDDTRGFGGLLWHATELDAEYFYLRKHKSGLPDAGQYTPIRNGLTGWQIYSDRNAIAPFAFTHDGWNRFKLVVEGDRADIYFNGSPVPVLHIPDLAADRGAGGIGFRASGPNGEIRISNFSMRPLEPGEGVVGVANDDRQAPAGVIERWSVSRPFDEATIDGQMTLPEDLSANGSLGTLTVEPFGIADISRLVGPDDGSDTVLVSARIASDSPRKVRLRFGYSDRVRLFLNGELIFDGSAGFRSRDFFFLGTVGFSDAVVLDLQEGENVLSAAVSETFGGWGFAGAVAEGAGLRISP